MNDSVATTGCASSSTPPTLQDRWKAHISHWSQSGLSKSAYCKSAGVDYHQMIYWSRKFSTRNNAEVAKKDNSSTSVKGSGFIAVSVTPAATGLFIRLPNGIEIGGIEEQRLTHIINLISG